jgi:hypothetical protein
MNTKMKEQQEDLEALLPWHAAGTLNRRDSARVEQALASDKELALRYALVREELNETIHLNETLGAPSARAMDKLFAMIDAEPARRPTASFSLGSWLTNFVTGFSPRTLAYGATAAALAIVLQAGILAGLVVKERAVGPQLASYEQPGTVGSGSYVQIRFKAQATAAGIAKFLSDNKASIVGGPAAGTGLFRVRVADRVLPDAELGVLARTMAQADVVDVAVPSSQP